MGRHARLVQVRLIIEGIHVGCEARVLAENIADAFIPIAGPESGHRGANIPSRLESAAAYAMPSRLANAPNVPGRSCSTEPLHVERDWLS
ncbi:MAG TPA: hypothetical protein VFX74_06935 [Candidatus Limnocylindria bacterium]|nr:hypothetical protein [Candidatus Limnocylindria bacterium]